MAIANAHGIDGFKGNGNNVRDVLTLTKQAVEKARSGGGPTYLEFSTYRWREHCGPNYDNDIGYRDQQECDDWMLCDPLKQLSSNTLSSEDEEQLVLKIKNEIDLAVDFAKNDKYPEAFALYENVFAK